MYKFEDRIDRLERERVIKSWKDNQEQPLTSEGFVEVAYKISDPDLGESEPKVTGNSLTLPPLSNRSMQFPDSELLDEIERTVTPYATLEHDLWTLDGKRITVPESEPYEYSGYISNQLCDANRIFNVQQPQINITFKQSKSPQILPGVTILWGTAYNEYPTKFEVNAKSGNSIIAKGMPIDSGDLIKSVIVFEMVNTNEEMSDFSDITVEIKILEWCRGYRRARISKIFLGIIDVYKKDVLMNFSCTESIDPVSTSLPKYEVSFEIDNRNDNFNPLNKKGLTKFMMERQQITTKYGFRLGEEDIEFIPGGVYYLSEWSAPQNGLSASFKARDLLGFLNTPYYKGRFPTEEELKEFKGIRLRDLALEVLEEADLPKHKTGTVLWNLEKMPNSDNDNVTITTTAPLPICTLGECLQLIANTACCVIRFDREGILHIEPIGNLSTDLEINERSSYTRPEISLSKPVKQVDVSIFNYVSDGEKILHNDEELTWKGGTIIEFSDIAKDVSLYVNGSKINNPKTHLEIYSKCCVLKAASSYNGSKRKVEIKGTVLKPSERIFTTHANVANGETQPFKNMLITNDERAKKVGDWLIEHLNRRKQTSVDWRVDPRLDTGDIVNVVSVNKNDKNETKSRIRITSNNLSFSGAFKGKSEGVEI